MNVLLTCEHASNAVPARYRGCIAANARVLATHRAYDLGAKVAARTLARSLGAPLHEGNITRLLVEAGNKLNSAFLRSGLVDRIYWFKAPMVIGDGGLSAFEGDTAEMLADWQKINMERLGNDTLEIFESGSA